MHTQGIDTAAGLGIASCVLFIYDYALTFAKEKDLFWHQPRRTWSFAFFVANRYIGLSGRLLNFLVNCLPNNIGSDSSVRVQACSSLERLSWEFFKSSEERDRRVLSLLVVVGILCLGIGGGAILLRPPSTSSEQIATAQAARGGCLHPITSEQAPYWAAAWGSQLLLDVLVFVFTLRKLLSNRSFGERTFMALSLRDGALYFAVMTAANIANITAYLVVTIRKVDAICSNKHALCDDDLEVDAESSGPRPPVNIFAT
ncbi:hypothetical protein F5J12DRAFT_409475 [Pisolithus orientalis]|uniref:uncharacterized protein n=1 Tax=Pisolithus orientalis TaxID=936130 RepID=UPI002224E5F6|nr:uncharacterized protein F5J12DRAFT_409475 [Pisolithus orientalis]KAI5994914.1 hypothetical protein F5J12DRAFT_409475 [Pisolithus orientalis]